VSKSKIFGLGLSRTGTKSLTSALTVLGYRISHYPNDRTTLKELQSAIYQFSILQDYDGITDITVAPFYAQLDTLYPNSKFILTVRDQVSWLRSLQKHWLYEFELLDKNNGIYPLDYESHVEITNFLKVAVFGCCDFNPIRMAYVYDLHCQNVINYFRDRPQDLLVLNICEGEGWEKLCTFLKQPFPVQPFPMIQTETQLFSNPDGQFSDITSSIS
jgi:hypothetical protein